MGQWKGIRRENRETPGIIPRQSGDSEESSSTVGRLRRSFLDSRETPKIVPRQSGDSGDRSSAVGRLRRSFLDSRKTPGIVFRQSGDSGDHSSTVGETPGIVPRQSGNSGDRSSTTGKFRGSFLDNREIPGIVARSRHTCHFATGTLVATLALPRASCGQC